MLVCIYSLFNPVATSSNYSVNRKACKVNNNEVNSSRKDICMML